jgi:hypothetical protein
VVSKIINLSDIFAPGQYPQFHAPMQKARCGWHTGL